MIRSTLVVLLALATAVPACAAQTTPAGFQAVSLLGDTLREFPLTPAARERYEGQLAAARAAWERAPADADSIVWLGRRLAYLGRVTESIRVYSDGIARHPENPWLYRHRGHRYITLRDTRRAIADLERAARLMERMPDQVEPDGLPNALNQPIGTLRSNVWYHLALAHYLDGDFAKAVPIYQRELAEATNDDRRVSAAHWLYMSLRRLGRDAEAAGVLTPIHPRMQVIENDTYHRLLLLYKGELPADSLLPATGEVDPAAAYGVGNWHLYHGRPAEAEQVFRRILAGGQWPAFGFIAAEAELARSR